MFASDPISRIERNHHPPGSVFILDLAEYGVEPRRESNSSRVAPKNQGENAQTAADRRERARERVERSKGINRKRYSTQWHGSALREGQESTKPFGPHRAAFPLNIVVALFLCYSSLFTLPCPGLAIYWQPANSSLSGWCVCVSARGSQAVASIVFVCLGIVWFRFPNGIRSISIVAPQVDPV